MGRVVNETELAALVEADRRAGHTIAFANGCFDVLHVGHVRYLQGAAREADRLIVAINNDVSVRALKGAGRPILDADARAELVAALRGVDYVVRFGDPTVDRLLGQLKPDVHCKGTDYTMDTVPERETVRRYGGRIAIVGDPKDHSTRDLLAQIAGTGVAPPPPASRLPKPERILVVRLGSLGDLVHTLPAVSAIRRAFPDAEIDWLVDEVHVDFLRLVTIITAPVVLRGRTAAAWLDVAAALRRRKYDVAVDFQGLIKSAALARLSGARRIVGFDRGSLREQGAALFYGERCEAGEGQHVIDKNLRLAAAIGAAGGPVEFPIGPVQSAPVQAFRASHPGPYALINPGAAWPNKRWPPARFGDVARGLAAQYGLASVVLWGPGELDAARAIVSAAGGAATLAPETTLPDLVAIARGARLMISGDTGPLHIAAAVGVPVVAVFGPTNPARNGPWAADDVSLSKYETCDCHYERRCRRPADAWCLGMIGADAVLQAVDVRLARASAEPRARG